MKITISIVIILLLGRINFAQENHDHHKMNMKDTTGQNMMSMKMNNHNHEMSSGLLLTIPMSMEGSGTSWHPENSTMYGHMYTAGDWMLMLHGDIKIGYTHQGGKRGENAFTAPNWIMGMAQTKIGINSQLMFRIMVSLDRITEGGDGYPLLFQTGETWMGEHLVDKQHPHDLFSEVSVAFSHRFSNKWSSYFYIGYPGEPALGPPVFMHRPSAVYNPNAPIGHHWQDATHITFGTATAGLVYGKFKIEGSIFTGREPDENRYNFDKPLFDSYSGRISFNPTKELALQFSTGLINNPEGHGDKVQRTTFSALYSKKFDEESYWDNTFVWGMNDGEHSGATHSFLLESSYSFSGNAFYTRLELVQKPQSELNIFLSPLKEENIGAYTLGYNRKLFSFLGMDFRSGIQASLYSFSDELENFYGSSLFSYQVYLQIHPSIM